MAYSHTRLRKTLALVRILTGFQFLVLGAHKISSLEFARVEFPQFVSAAIDGAAVKFYGDLLHALVWPNTSKVAILVAMTELFIGVGLLLGLAVRPISALGMVYLVNILLATWMAPGPGGAAWRYLDNAGKPILLFFLFVLFAVGHAGENWGLGALYHRRRHRLWERTAETAPQATPAAEPGPEVQAPRAGPGEPQEGFEVRETWEWNSTGSR